MSPNYARSAPAVPILYIIDVLALPRGFDSVRSVRFKGDQAIFTALSGRRVVQALDRDFLSTP